MKALAKYEHSQTWQPPTVSRRVAAQHSQFVYSVVRGQAPHGTISMKNPSKDLMVISISAEMKQIYLSMLTKCFDVSALTLFPDIDGFGAVNGDRFGQFDYARW